MIAYMGAQVLLLGSSRKLYRPIRYAAQQQSSRLGYRYRVAGNARQSYSEE